MKRSGTLVLTEGRSGSNWLGSLTNVTGLLGSCEEWIDARHSGVEPGSVSLDDFISAVLDKASTPNSYFCIKLFPRHLFKVQNAYDRDLITELQRRFDTQLIVLQRRDRLAQAISFARAYQTGAWQSTDNEKRDPDYSFDAICRSYFFVQRSYDFWETYLDLRSLDASKFYYEDMMDDCAPYMDAVRDHAGIQAEASDKPSESKLSIQRDTLNDEWRVQFVEDLKVKNMLPSSLPRPPVLTGQNLVNFLRQRPTKPKPFTW